jgi:hypothetical protein
VASVRRTTPTTKASHSHPSTAPFPEKEEEEEAAGVQNAEEAANELAPILSLVTTFRG